MIIDKLLFFFSPISLFGFLLQPWYFTVGEFQCCPTYSYSYYPSVSKGENPSSYHCSDHRIALNAGVQFWPNWEMQLESDFLHSLKLNWGLERFGLQLRHIFLDDVIGDPMSLSLGLQGFYVPTRSMRNVSVPYHGQGNAELGIAIGKEIDRLYDWLFRFWGFLGLGMANRGSPWIRPCVAVEMKGKKRYIFKAFTEFYGGLGDDQNVNINDFSGYGKIAHRSIDLGLNWTYLFAIWGDLHCAVSYRLYAHSFPKHASNISITYQLPFSIF